MEFRSGSTFLFAAAMVVAAGTCAWAATGVGPFTQAQVTAGRADYRAHCALCHGAALAGSAEIPALTGKQFNDSWSTRTTKELWQFIAASMPEDNPGSLTGDTYLNVTAYILAVNGAKPGAAPFTKDSIVPIRGIADGQTVAAVIRPPP